MVGRRSQRPFNIAYYQRNRDQEIARVRMRQDATLAFLRELRRVPCAVCGQTFEPHQMDFDHRDRDTKSFRVTAGRAMLMSRARLVAEVSKCDVVCANCHRVRTQTAHARRPADHRVSESPSRRRKRARWALHDRLLDALRDVPCIDCGRRYPPCAMDFDHRVPEEKASGVTRMRGRAAAERILAEAAKCDIVCANCHRLRTFTRRVAAVQQAGVAQLAERDPSKVDVAGSIPVSRSKPATARQLR